MKDLKNYVIPGVLALAFVVYIALDRMTSKPDEKIPPEPVITKGQNVSVIDPCKLYRLESKEGTFVYWSICTDTLKTGDVIHSTRISTIY